MQSYEVQQIYKSNEAESSRVGIYIPEVMKRIERRKEGTVDI